jgi:anti-anti-sigma regulatory factor
MVEMATVAEWQKVDGEHAADTLRSLAENLNSGDGELVLDFSAVQRLNAAALSALDQLVTKAEKESVRVVLRAVNIDVYKVLKLAKVAWRVGFLN